MYTKVMLNNPGRKRLVNALAEIITKAGGQAKIKAVHESQEPNARVTYNLVAEFESAVVAVNDVGSRLPILFLWTARDGHEVPGELRTRDADGKTGERSYGSFLLAKQLLASDLAAMFPRTEECLDVAEIH